jgi:ferredoxin
VVRNIFLNRFKCVREYGDNSCNLCLENCPTNAIKLNKGKIMIDPSKCTYCGACQRVCPNEAMILVNLNEIKSLKCEGLGGDIPCIAFVGLEFLTFFNNSEMVFCKKCNKGIDINKELERLKEIIKDLNIRIKLEDPIIDTLRRIYLYKINVEEFYLVLKEPPLKRMVMRDKLKFYKEIDANKCTFCTVCVSVCPNGALKIEDKGVISFNNLNCTGCKLCINSCKYSALRESNVNREVLIRIEPKRCQYCGSLYYGKGDKCQKCEREDKELKELFTNFY